MSVNMDAVWLRQWADTVDHQSDAERFHKIADLLISIGKTKMITNEQLENWFTYHPPEGEAQIKAYKEIRNAGYVMAATIRDLTPPSADQTAAIRKVREAVMTANAAIACEGGTE